MEGNTHEHSRTVSGERSAARETGLVRKSNCLIWSHIAWTVLQHRVTAMLIAQLDSSSEEFEMHRFNVKELIPNRIEDNREIRPEDVCEQIFEQTIHTAPCETIGEREYQGYNCFSTCRYDVQSGDIEAKFNNGMRAFLFGPDDNFTTYRLAEFMQLRSRYSMRIYELIKMKEEFGELALPVGELRSLIGCEDDVCSSLAEVEEKVLRPSQVEIRERCDTYFTYSTETEESGLETIHFTIHRSAPS